MFYVLENDSGRAPLKYVDVSSDIDDAIKPHAIDASTAHRQPIPDDLKPHQKVCMYGSVKDNMVWYEVETRDIMETYEFFSMMPPHARQELVVSTEPEVRDAMFLMSLQPNVSLKSMEVQFIVEFIETAFGINILE